MDTKTPERARSGSRASTPHSGFSNPPMRTPRRRRATIVSANLLTPKRQRRVSDTPQNTLRVLSRALSKQIEQEKEKQQLSHDVKEETIEKDDFLSVTHEENTAENEPTSDLHEEIQDIRQITSYQNEIETAFDEDEGKVSRLSSEHSSVPSPRELKDFESTFSDIAIPEGVMPPYLDRADQFLKTPELSKPVYQPFESRNADITSTDSHDEYADLQYDNSIKRRNSLRTHMGTQKYVSTSDEDGQSEDHWFTEEKRLKRSTRRIRHRKIRDNNEMNRKIPKKSILKFAQRFTQKSIVPEASNILIQATNQFLSQLSDDMSAYTNHNRKSIVDLPTVVLLMKRQRHIKNINDLDALAEESIPLEEMLKVRRNLRKLF